MIKRVLQSLIFVCVLFMCVSAEIPSPGENFANDYANVLSVETKNHINETSRKYSGDGTQIVVVTVKSLDGMDIETYANKLFRSWGIGNKEKDNGILILLATDDRKLRIEVGRGLEGTFNDAKCGRLMDAYAIPQLKENNYDEGIRNLYDAVIEGVENPVFLEELVEAAEVSISEVIGIIVLIILYLIFIGRRGGGGFIPIFFGGYHGGGHRGGFGGGGFGGFGGGSSGGGGASRGF